MFRGIQSADKRWELTMEILLCFITALIYLGWGCIANFNLGTSSRPTPYTYAWTSTSSTINNTVTTTQRHVQPIAIGPAGEEYYSTYEAWYTIVPTVVMFFVGVMKFFAAWSEGRNELFPNAQIQGKGRYADPVTAAVIKEGGSIANVMPMDAEYEPPKKQMMMRNSAVTGLVGAADGMVADGGDDKAPEGKKDMYRARYGTLFFPLYAATGFMYMVPGAVWFPIVMYHMGHDATSQKYMFVCASVLMGAAVISVEGATHLAWSGKTKTSYTISVVTWICYFLSMFLTCVAGSTMGSIITNQEIIWNNPLTGSDTAYASLTVYPLATTTRFLYATNTLDYYNALVDAKILIYYFYSVQAIRSFRLGAMLVMEYLGDYPSALKSGGRAKQVWSTEWFAVKIVTITGLVFYLALFAEPIVQAALFCHGDFSIISGQFKMPPGRTKVL